MLPEWHQLTKMLLLDGGDNFSVTKETMMSVLEGLLYSILEAYL